MIMFIIFEVIKNNEWIIFSSLLLYYNDYFLSIYILVSLHTFWTYCTAIYGLTLLLNTIFHNKLSLELEAIINNWNICLRIIITLDNKVGILYIIGQNNWPMKLKHWYISYLSNSFIFQTSKPQNLLIQQTQSSTSHSDTLTKKYTMYIFIPLKAITLIITITPQIQLYHSLRLRYWVCLYWLNRDERIHNLFFILQLILIIALSVVDPRSSQLVWLPWVW
jgi:hypothetical protein